ncbi:patatin-like phospholipase family protein [Rufibacter sediminis]|uniref:Patatin-like phospholipase family protein n=1 Tax=Rufibacter sediminis TaxID=2762756 RepID=A0ABR6VQN1_9BACT|nr:patatin-like phospholipase family protein [Rufibacter sediminis]MBC3539510.1 patatin-like phospholipase family protein [Rufibacter sediminis]
MPKLLSHLRVLLVFILLLSGETSAQKVGLVLSGGGAKGLAHVGVLKVLEKNNIPIDYIVGTSMGAVVGSLYSAGFSPQDIEDLVLSPKFQYWVSGRQLEDHAFNYFSLDPSPAALRLPLTLQSSLKVQTTGGLISDVNLNYALASTLAAGGAIAEYDFNKLFVPFRALTAEIFTRQQIVQRSGSLADAVRNSMAVPLAFRPIRQSDGRYLFDGGLFNNFPTDVMRTEFKPDVIIGVNVGDVSYKKYPKEKDDELLGSSLIFLSFDVADTLAVGPNGVLIQPDLEGFGTTDFAKVKELIDLGVKSAEGKLPLLKERITRQADSVQLAHRRTAFQSQAPPPRFARVQVKGLKENQNTYVSKFFLRKGDNYTIDDIEEGYYRLAANDFFRGIYPRIQFDSTAGGYVLNIDAQQSNNATAEVGAVFSTRPVDNLYVGLEYRYLNRLLYTMGLNANLGRFYSAGQFGLRVNVPARLPFYIEPSVMYSSLNYQGTKTFLDRDAASTQVRQRDFKVGLQAGFSHNFRSRFVVDGSYFSNEDEYANVENVSSDDVLDETDFVGLTTALRFERNSLNRKMYSTRGHRAVLGFRAVMGEEAYKPGSTSLRPDARTVDHKWVQFSATYEGYYPFNNDKSSWGYFFEGMVSTQGLFSNYRSSLTSAPTFSPLPDSRTLFLDTYRATRYAAAGLRYSQNLFTKFEWRTEAFVHLRHRPLEEGDLQQAVRASGFDRPRLTASTGLIMQLPIGPAALHFIHYDNDENRWGVFGHVGFLLFRPRTLQ